MGALVNFMEACGYVERTSDPNDGRAKLVCLTARGWAVDVAARGIMSQTENEWAEKLGQERFAALKQTLQALNALIEA